MRRLLSLTGLLVLAVGCDDGGGGGGSSGSGGSPGGAGGGGSGGAPGGSGGSGGARPDASTGCESSDVCEAGRLCLEGACVACSGDAQCAADARYGDGARCDGGACVADECPDGTTGCECGDDRPCATGECLDQICVDCTRGQDGCICMNNGACDAGLRCTAERCEACPAGESGCACDGDACRTAGEVCLEGVCAVDPCPAGSDGCPCIGGVRCDGELVCGGDDLCRACANDLEGCPCTDGACEARLVCDEEADTCRAERRCADGGCALHQRCDDGEDGADALCLSECEGGFTWNAEAGRCDELATRTCSAGAADDISAGCATDHRQCVEEVAGQAFCGDCVAGFVEEADACRAVRTCADLGCVAQNRQCAEVAGADAVCGSCLDGYNEQAGACVANVSCDALDCVARHRTCGGDPPRCGGCDEGFVDVDGQCVGAPSCDPDAENSIAADCADQSRACVELDGEATCGECIDDTIQNPETGDCEVAIRCADLPCEGLGRACAGEPFAACGDCAAGTRPSDPDDPLSACTVALTCADIVCGDNEFCLEGEGGADASCERSFCGPGEAYRADTDECVVCGNLCGEVGETGDIWPFTLQFSDDCLCETQTGYYADVSGAVRALPCDADGDGWVRVSAEASLTSADTTVTDNARCDLRKIDRFTLENELGQTLDVRSCADGWVSDPDVVCATEPVSLYESVRNDDATELARQVGTDAPRYAQGGVGRALRAEEVNPLTKACVSVNADYNDDRQTDASEHHAADPADDLETPLHPFLGFAYFVELHRGYYQAPGEGERYGRYVIEERSRCDDGFPVGYAESEGAWGEQCSRNRDASYDADPSVLTPIGFDFAQYGCDERTGACALASPVTEDGLADQIPPHGLCQLATLPPVDGVWRGMNHHSQFKCTIVSAANELPADRKQAPQRLLTTELYNGVQTSRYYQFNRCHVTCPDGDDDCSDDCVLDGRCAESSVTPGGLANPSRPVIECEPVLQDALDAEIAAREVGFVAVRYIASAGNYVRGCIDEWDPSALAAESLAWKQLCPGYVDNPAAVVGVANPENFGKLICGCGLNFGGPSCSIGCPYLGVDTDGDGVLDQDVGPLAYGGPPENDDDTCVNGYCPVVASDDGDGGRKGYWLCGGFTATTYQPPEGESEPVLRTGSYELRGAVPVSPFSGDRLCESDDCDTGFSIRKASVIDRDR